jgi:DNA uptake protein ComE-like DNA-binding protein
MRVRTRMRMKFIITAALVVSLLLISACSNQDTEKTKQEAAKATEQIKEGSKVAAVELKKDAKEAAKQSKAIAEGVKQGLATPDKPVNINAASKTKLQTLPGIDEETAGRIIKGRPYHTTDELGTKGVVSPEQFKAIKDKIVVR